MGPYYWWKASHRSLSKRPWQICGRSQQVEPGPSFCFVFFWHVWRVKKTIYEAVSGFNRYVYTCWIVFWGACQDRIRRYEVDFSDNFFANYFNHDNFEVIGSKDIPVGSRALSGGKNGATQLMPTWTLQLSSGEKLGASGPQEYQSHKSILLMEEILLTTWDGAKTL